MTIVGVGGVSNIVEEVVYKLYEEEEINIDIVFPQLFSPLNLFPIHNSIKVTHKLLVIEEGTEGHNFGSQIISEISREIRGDYRVIFDQISTPKVAIPSSKFLEEQIIPDAKMIYQKCLELFYE